MRAKPILLIFSVVLTACGSTSGTASFPSPSPSSSMPSPTPSAEKEKPPPLADARLQGSWALEFKGAGKTKAVINFDPTCKEGPCDVVLKTDPSIRLRQKGTLYTGKDKGFFGATCSGAGIKSSVDLMLRIQHADMTGSKWLATVTTGVLRQSVAPQKGCSAAKQTYKVKGTPTTASPKGRNDLPAITLSRPKPAPTSATPDYSVGGGPPPPPDTPYVICTINPFTGEQECHHA